MSDDDQILDPLDPMEDDDLLVGKKPKALGDDLDLDEEIDLDDDEIVDTDDEDISDM